MFRTIRFLLNLTGYTVWYASKAVVAGLLRLPNRPGGTYDEITRRWARGVLRGARIEGRLIGWEKVPQDTAVVFASNHQSWFDIFLIAGLIPGHMRFVSKKELSRIPLLGRAMAQSGHIFIDRENRQRAFDAYDEAALAIRRGTSAVVFPEGTRSRTGELQSFKKGPFVLAIAAQVPVVPTYCAGTFTLLPKGTIRLTPHPVVVLFGDPIPTAGMTYSDRERLMSATRAEVERLREQSKEFLA
ncbi:MAG: 1-acyl-sn-glycerol-3-phosphate acyltransferase [Gemmatimonadetes bacterium]|nr:1-acyl-sn-glycerol-3-phosphate acyltransferase [Gemmatimonadota bacterium]